MKKTIVLAVFACLVFACGGNGLPGDPCLDGTCPDNRDALESVIVDLVTAVSAPAEGVVTVSLRDHGAVFLDVGTQRTAFWAEVFGRRRDSGESVYLEIAPETRMILDFLIPMENQVHALIAKQDGVEVQLMPSAAIHFLPRSHPAFERFLGTLEYARQLGTLVLVTTDYDHRNEIKDVREPLAP